MRRKLFPGESVTPLIVSPPDTSGTAEVHIVEREDGPSETDDLLVPASKKSKQVSMFAHTYIQCTTCV